jgi:hypothetical protein
VVGARSESIVDPCAAADPNDLMMQAGRPLIVVPPNVLWLDVSPVLVARKDVSEARRAGFDALPILAAAKRGHDCRNSRAGRRSQRCYMLQTWRRGRLTTVSSQIPSFRTRQAALPNSLTGLRRMSEPAQSLRVPMATQG